MQKVNNLDTWVANTTASDSWRTVAEKLRTTHSTIQRRLKNHEADAIVELAHAYDVNPVEGLVAAGVISDIDVRTYAVTYTVEDLSDLDLAQIIVDRLEARQAKENETPETHPQLTGLPYSADDSPDEPEEGDDGYHDGP